MFTVTMGRSLVILSVVAASGSSVAAAQAPVIISSGGSGVFGARIASAVGRTMQISDDSVRSYLTRFEPGVLDDDSGDANIVTMVLDSDGSYVRSSSRHAKVIQAVPGQIVAINGDSARVAALAGRVMMIAGDTLRTLEEARSRLLTLNADSVRAVVVSSGSGGAQIAAVGAPLGSVINLRTGEAMGAPLTLAGLSPDEVGGIATRHYGAGEMGQGQIIVTLIYLK